MLGNIGSSACVVMALAITTPTYFEICEPCKAQNRGARPWLAPVAQQPMFPGIQRKFFNTFYNI